MGFLAGKKILITGLLSSRSIAYGIAHACKREGAVLAFTYVNDDLKDRVVKLAADFGSAPVLPCDVTHDDQIAALFGAVEREWGGLDGLLHSIAFAPREALAGDFLNARVARGVRHCARRELVQLRRAGQGRPAADAGQARRAADAHLPRRGAGAAELQRDGARQGEPRGQRALSRAMPGPGRRSASTPYRPGRSRRSLRPASAAFRSILHFVAKTAPLRRNVTIEEVGNVAAFLLSDLASAVTGEITYVDCGFSTVAAGMGEE